MKKLVITAALVVLATAAQANGPSEHSDTCAARFPGWKHWFVLFVPCQALGNPDHGLIPM